MLELVDLSFPFGGRILEGMPKRTVLPPVPLKKPAATVQPIPPLKQGAKPVKRLRKAAR
jgi:hypothetical protein